MNDLDFSFEDSPWEAFLRTKRAGDTVSAANLLTMLEEENEQVVEDALQALEDGGLNLNVFDLPKTSGSGEAALRLRQEAQLVEKGLNPGELEPNDPLRLYLEEVAQLSTSGDEQALAETAAKFGAYCRKIADNILHSAHDAEECENDTWLAAWNSMPTNRPARLAPYLGRITRNLALDRFDRAAAQKRGSGQTCAPLDELAECVAAPGSVEDSFDAAETGRLISAFLRTLPEETRSIFLRRYWYCDATADIAARYGLTESKVRVTLHRTRGKLAAYLQERGAAL